MLPGLPLALLASLVVSSDAGSLHGHSSKNHGYGKRAQYHSSEPAQPAADDLHVLIERRYETIVGAATSSASIPSWLSTLQPDGSWPDVDYIAGCDAPRANWKAQTHWQRTLTFASAWHGGLRNSDQYVHDVETRTAISSAMDFWFSRDFAIPACLDYGGEDECPCGTPGLWNTNWFSNVVGIPTFVGEVCLLLGESLTPSELYGCEKMTGRAFATLATGINGVSNITGANALDIASIGIDLGLLTMNETLLSAGFDHVHKEVIVQNGTKVDGIRADGSFGQHSGIIYNGNYGKDYANDLFSFEIETAGTKFEAPIEARSALEVLVDANQWMIYRNVLTNILHWDFSVIGRFMTDPVADDHASSGIKTNLTQLQVLGELWKSDVISSAYEMLSTNTTSANSGNIIGNRIFYANDYVVQRGPGYVTSLRMYSKRTQNTECTAEANNFGFHLADGTMYTHMIGDEYEDIVAAWDWNLIPGTTVDYGAIPLACNTTRKTGTQTFVGGASDGRVGAVAMRYETPTWKTLNWRKTWFFLENDVQVVMVARITSNTGAPVLSVLDQRKHVGGVLVNGEPSSGGNFSDASTLWHGGVGYVFNVSDPVTLSLDVANKTGSWSDIGASSDPAATVDMFSAWLSHDDLSAAISYMVFPATTPESFTERAAAATTDVHIIRNDGSISALVDSANKTVYGVFWQTDGGQFTIPAQADGDASIKVQSSGSANVILRMDSWTLTVADPTQLLASVNVTFTLGSGTPPLGWGSSTTKSVSLELPSGGEVGSSVSWTLE
ncbi:polysaccharide lyase family 8 protein [Daedaleopsis nitida]|nr:polysaccharide lyase family 8 protein [Daedaleopsis nitida]